MYYTIQNNILLTADNEQALSRFYDNILPLPEDYEEDKYIVVDSALALNPEWDEIKERKKKQARIAELKQLLADADYWGQKYLDGEYTEKEWAEKVAQRKAWREEIRSLEE